MTILEGSKIFNPQAKVVANLERALEFFETGNTSPVRIEIKLMLMKRNWQYAIIELFIIQFNLTHFFNILTVSLGSKKFYFIHIIKNRNLDYKICTI